MPILNTIIPLLMYIETEYKIWSSYIDYIHSFYQNAVHFVIKNRVHFFNARYTLHYSRIHCMLAEDVCCKEFWYTWRTFVSKACCLEGWTCLTVSRREGRGAKYCYYFTSIFGWKWVWGRGDGLDLKATARKCKIVWFAQSSKATKSF